MSAPHRFADLVRTAATRVTALEPGAFADRCARIRARGDRLFVLDVREGHEISSGCLPGSTCIPRGIVESKLEQLAPATETPILIVCQSGARSVLVADSLQRMGYADVSVLAGGLDRWRAEGFEVDAPYSSAPKDAAPNITASAMSWDQIRRAFSIVGRKVPVVGGLAQGSAAEMPLVYLDHAASTHAPDCVLERYAAFMRHEYANIHRGTHHLSRSASHLFDDCYRTVASFIGGDLQRSQVVFTGNTTQAIDLCSHVLAEQPGDVIVTELEHHSNDLPHRRRGRVWHARVDAQGRLDLEHMRALLRRQRIKLVAVTGASNVSGWLPEIHTVAKLAHEHGALVMVDAAQRLAHAAIDVRDDDDPAHLDFIAAAGHKAYAPFGAAFLYGPRRLFDAAPPYLPGGGTASLVTAETVEFVGTPDRHQGGTPNIGGVIALAQALRFLHAVGLERVREHEQILLRRALGGLRDIPGVHIYGPPEADERIGVIAFNVRDVSDLLAAAVLSEECAIACRNGRFCAHIYMDRLLTGQGGATEIPGSTPGAVRASFGLYNNLDDVDRLIAGVRMLAERRWAGHYRIRENQVSAEFAGRCNDHWMEAEPR